MDEVQSTSILKTGRPAGYKSSISWLPPSQMRLTLRDSISERFSALALNPLAGIRSPRKVSVDKRPNPT